jgi:CheY-like chemotaxis protein
MEVSDSGIGIKPEDKKNIFGDFVRVDLERNKSVEGTGLGLAITKSLCMLMGGDIRLESEYGTGTVFTVTIPQGRTEAAAEEKLAAVENPQSKSVLLYDHRPAYAESLLETLHDLGVPAALASSAGELLEQLSADAFAFVFVSARLLEQAARLIRDKSLKASLIVLADSDEAAAPENASGIAGTVIPMPAYAVSIANALNGKTGAPYREDVNCSFIAPGARLLVVDDLATNLKVTGGLLALYQAEVDTCLSGIEAIELVKKYAYDIVFMDHMMPGMDGIEAAAEIRAWEKTQAGGANPRKPVPVIALTANAMAGVKEMFLENGFSDFLSKPVELSKLDEIMTTWIPDEKKLPVPAAAAGNAHNKQVIKPEVLAGFPVEGVDIAAGIERYHDAYAEILRSYCADTAGLLEKLRCLPEGDFSKDRINEYAIAAHGLKGSSYGIFANGMGKLAEFMEHTARAGDAQTIKAQNSRFVETTARLLASLEDLLQKAGPPEAHPTIAAPAPALLQKLAAACARYRAKEMEEALNELEQYEYESGGELVQWLREQADNFEYDAIRERLTGIR